MESNILLESGTNELEVLEFMVGEQSFGINIAKVTEIMNYQPMVPVPDSHPAFEGVFTPRDKVISVINLHTILHKESPDPEHDLLSTMPAPDFPTGGEIIYDRAQMENIYRTGRGSFKVRAYLLGGHREAAGNVRRRSEQHRHRYSKVQGSYRAYSRL